MDFRRSNYARIGLNHHHHKTEDRRCAPFAAPEKMGAPQKLGIADPTEHSCTTMTSNAAENDGTLWICQLLIADRSPRHQKLMSMISGANATF